MFELDAKKIRLLMIERQMTIRKLAKTAKVTEVTLSKILCGGKKVNARVAGAVASALGISAETIILEGI